MNKKILSALLAALLTLSLVALTSCTSDGTTVGGTANATIAFDGDKITLSDSSAGTIDGSDLKITKGGTYTLSGTLNDGQITVEVSKETNVTLVLSGVSLSCSDSAPIFVRSAKNCYIELAEGTTNTVTDGKTYVYANALETEPNAAIFSKADLFIEGSGSLTVTGSYNNGIASKDDLEIKSGNITVTAENNGIKGKDSVVIQGGTINVTAKGDAIKADENTDPLKGYVQVDSGTLTLNAVDEGIQAETNVNINGGSITIQAESNGVKANIDVKISGGALNITCGSDGVDCPSVSGSATVNGEQVTY